MTSPYTLPEHVLDQTIEDVRFLRDVGRLDDPAEIASRLGLTAAGLDARLARRGLCGLCAHARTDHDVGTGCSTCRCDRAGRRLTTQEKSHA